MEQRINKLDEWTSKKGDIVTLKVIGTTNTETLLQSEGLQKKEGVVVLNQPTALELDTILYKEETKEVWVTDNVLTAYELRKYVLSHQKTIVVVMDIPQKEDQQPLLGGDTRRYFADYEADAGMVFMVTEGGVQLLKNRFGRVGIVEKERLFA